MRRSNLLVLGALLVVGCSGVGPSPSVPTLAPTPPVSPSPTPKPSPTVDPDVGVLRAAATATITAQTVGFDQSVTFLGNVTTRDGAAITGSGALSFGPRRQMVMTADYSAISGGTMRMILDDQSLYMSGSFLRGVVPTGKWLLVDLTSKDPRAVPFLALTKGQSDNSLVMYDLFGAVPRVRNLGSEQVDGSTTNHYQFVLDLEIAPDVVPASEREYMLDAIAALRAGSIDRTIDGQAWIGPDGYVHRVMYTYTLGPPAGGGTLQVVYTLRDFGRPIELGVPEASSVVRLEDVKSPSP